MNAPASLPENIRSDISIYLAPGEKIIKALSPFGNAATTAGQVWLILTGQSVLFHTCETGKEPLVAMLPRKDIREIEYFQKQTGVQLTFVPTGKGQISRLNFAPEKQEELEDFCEELADLINFKKETASGVKIYSAPRGEPVASSASDIHVAVNKPAVTVSGRQSSDSEPELRHAASALKHTDNAEPTAAPAVEKPPAKPAAVPEVDRADKPTPPRPVPRPVIDTAGVKIVKAHAGRAVPETSASSSSGRGREITAGFVITATLISLLVAFIWYRFFILIAGWKEPRQS